YGPAEPLLIPGKKYAFRIQAYDVSGRDLFKNQGYSETFHFQYGDACMAVDQVAGEVLGKDRIKITWEGDFAHTGFEIKYKQRGNDNWRTEATLVNAQILPDLQPDTEYEYKVVGKCQQYYGDESTIRTLKTDVRAVSEEGDEEYACGTESQLDERSLNPLEGELHRNDKFFIGGVDVIVLEITANADGSYSGSGYVPVPMMNGAGMKVDIKNVQLNEDYYATAGKVVTVYNIDGGFIVGDQEGETSTAADNGAADLIVETVEVAADIETVTVDPNTGVITLTDADGTEIPLPEDADGVAVTLPPVGEVLVIADSNGDAWTIDEEGKVSKGTPAENGGGGSAPETISADQAIDFIVTFGPAATQTFGFDDPNVDGKIQNSLSSKYSKVTIQEEDYWVSWKSVATGYSDAVAVTSTGKDGVPDYLGFKTETGELAAQPGEEDNSKQLMLMGKSNKNVETLIAYVRQEDDEGTVSELTLSQLQVISYDKIREK
ncbi:MAG: fibronectin type III domain-containing protein, partial [Reichenbachiella sp.]